MPTTPRTPCRTPVALRLAALLVVETVLLAAVALVLWRLGSGPPFRSSLTVHAASPADAPADTLAVAAYWSAVAGLAWFLGATVLHTAAAVLRRPTLARLTARATVPAVRRVVAASLVAATVSSPAAAWSNDRGRAPTTITVRDGRAHATEAPAPPTPPDDGPAQDAPAAGGIVIREGESLWALTARVLAEESGRTREEITDDEIAPRWVQVCEANRDRLRSRDVNVVDVGEQIVVPPA